MYVLEGSKHYCYFSRTTTTITTGVAARAARASTHGSSFVYSRRLLSRRLLLALTRSLARYYGPRQCTQIGTDADRLNTIDTYTSAGRAGHYYKQPGRLRRQQQGTQSVHSNHRGSAVDNIKQAPLPTYLASVVMVTDAEYPTSLMSLAVLLLLPLLLG